MSEPGERPSQRRLGRSDALSSAPGESQPAATSVLRPGGAATSLETYLRSARMLRDIHSLKLSRTRRWADWLRFGLIALSTIATCVGFIGIGVVAKDIKVSEGLVNFLFDMVLLLLLLVVIWDLAWRQGDRAHEHQRALVVLTDFMSDLENRLRQPIDHDDVELVERFGERHELIIEILPPHTDADYLAAKKAAADKRVRKAAIAKRTEQRLARIDQGDAGRRLRRWR